MKPTKTLTRKSNMSTQCSKIFRTTTLCALVVISSYANANPLLLKNIAIEINGKVVDEKGEAMPGVNVAEKGTSNGAVTDADGKYTLSVTEFSILVFSSIGYMTQEISIKDQSTSIDITLQPDVKILDEIVVSGYSTQRKEDVTGALTSVTGEQIQRVSSPSISNSLAGVSPGLIINNRSGKPGEDDAKISIRGINSFEGGNSPLIVVDGIPGRNFNRLNPEDIESVTILKDAAAAIYGMQAANGVIVVTTKKGIVGKPTIRLNSSFGLQELTQFTQRVDAAEYMTYYNEISRFKNEDLPYSGREIQRYIDGDDADYTSTDWTKQVYKPLAPMNNYSLSVRGGTEAIKYYLSGQYLSQSSNFKNSKQSFENINLTSNTDVAISKNLNISLNLIVRNEVTINPSFGDSDILHETISMYPFLPAYWKNGLPSSGLSNGKNPILMMSPDAGYQKKDYFTLNPKFAFDLKLPFVVEGLSVGGWAAIDVVNTSSKTLNKRWHAYSYNKTSDTYNDQYATTAIPSISQSEQTARANTYFAKIAFQRNFGKHGINAYVAYQQETNTSKQISAYRRDLLNPIIDQIFTGGDKDQRANGSAYQSARASYFGNVDYDFNGKYLLNVIARYNGSFNFAPGKQWGFFPAVSAGWRISEEDFFKNALPFISTMKIKTSWGIIGSDDVRQYYFLAKYGIVEDPQSFTNFGSAVEKSLSIYRSAEPNPNITWEQQDTRNVGLEFGVLKNKLTFSIEYFRSVRSNILAQRSVSIPIYTGLSLPYENIGKSLNQGFEFNTNYNGKIAAVSIQAGFNFTYAKSKILYKDESANIPAWQRTTGRPINGWYYYETEGIYQNDDQVSASVHLEGAGPGDLWLKDKNGDGKITTLDRSLSDLSATPQLVYGIPINVAYKRLSLSAVFSGQALAKQMILPQSQSTAAVPPKWLYDARWTTENPDAKYPHAFNSSDARNSLYADIWLKDADFLRLKNVQLAYSIPFAKTKAVFSNITFYINGNNLFVVAPLTALGLDPETDNVTGVAYPQIRTYRFGINIDF